MRIVLFVACVAAIVVSAARADARTLAPPPLVIAVAWPAPVGHSQPRAGGIPTGIPLSPSRAEQENLLDRAIDEKLNICRGC
jgi:hypothetical protein